MRADWRLEVLLPLLILVSAYALGQWRLARRAPRTIAPWRVASWAVGVLGVAAALLSPLDTLAEALFSAHMVQHILLMLVAPPALLLARPFPALLWALPARVRAGAGRLLAPGTRGRTLVRALTSPAVAWLLYALVLWLWHLPTAYDAALGDRLLHDLEHIAFFGSALLFWWPIVAPAPRVRPPAAHGFRIVYLVLAAFQSGLLGLLLTLSPWVLYQSYGETAGLWGFTPKEDQALGGVVMWAVGGAIEMLAVLILLYRHLAAEDRPAVPARRPAPPSTWAGGSPGASCAIG